MFFICSYLFSAPDPRSDRATFPRRFAVERLRLETVHRPPTRKDNTLAEPPQARLA
jgi:hypothetical protein